MSKGIEKAVLCTVLIVAATGCAHTGKGAQGETEAAEDYRVRNTLIAVGAAIALGAIVANQAESNTKDIIRDVVQD